VTDTAVELETLEPVESAQSGQPARMSDEQLVAMLVERARSEGLQLSGQGSPEPARCWEHRVSAGYFCVTSVQQASLSGRWPVARKPTVALSAQAEPSL